VADRLAVHSPILSQTFDPGLAAEVLLGFENAFFDKMRFDVVVHEQSLICRGKFFGKRSVVALVKKLQTVTAVIFLAL